jgi:hypothetical protein
VAMESGCVDFWVGTRGYEHDPKNPYQRVNKMEKERVKGKVVSNNVICLLHK